MRRCYIYRGPSGFRFGGIFFVSIIFRLPGARKSAGQKWPTVMTKFLAR